MNPRRAGVALVLLVLLASGCGMTSEAAVFRLPVCGDDGYKTTVLMAQSVPGASRIPCLRSGLPSDWDLDTMRIDSAGARVVLLSDIIGDQPDRLEVVLADRCDTSEAYPTTTDEVGTRRFEHIVVEPGGYSGQRHYLFRGGCVTYRFTASADDWSGFVRQTARLWTFMTRRQVMGHAEQALGG